MIPYFVALLLVGIPVGWVEMTLARHGGRHGRRFGDIARQVGGAPLRFRRREADVGLGRDETT